MSLLQKTKLSALIIALGFIFSLPAMAATIELSLEKNIISSKEDITVLATINSEGQNINTAQAVLSFPANLLSVTKIDKTNSIFSFWLEEPAHDNSKGTIRFVGGSTSGLSGSGLKIMRIAFKVKGSGSGKLGVTDGAITASDGTGSNVYTTAKGLDINIPSTAEFQAVKIERANQEATLAKELPAQLGIDIPFYPDPSRWYNRSASFQARWKISSDTTKAAVSLTKNPESEPKASAEAMAGNQIFSALADGIWYLHLSLANNIGWSPTLHYRLAIDTTPPNPFKIVSDQGLKTNDPRPTINFASSDSVSGIKNYTIRLDNRIATTTNKASYRFPPLLPGIHEIMVTATDQANNSNSQKISLEIIPIKSPRINYVNTRVALDGGEINAGGTAEKNVSIIVQIENSQKQKVFEQNISTNEEGNWSITINKNLARGYYHLLATAQDKNLASSFPATSETIRVRPNPVLILGNLEISQTGFFVGLIIILLGGFGAGWFSYRNWREKLERRVIIAERDVLNTLSTLDKKLDKVAKNLVDGEIDETDIAELEYSVKEMRSYLEKSRRYVAGNIKEIGN